MFKKSMRAKEQLKEARNVSENAIVDWQIVHLSSFCQTL
jgi:hypothetical protein